MMFLVRLTPKWAGLLELGTNEIYVTFEDLTFVGATKLKLLKWLETKHLGQPGSAEVVHMGHKIT
jgi:hypothetical protein